MKEKNYKDYMLISEHWKVCRVYAKIIKQLNNKLKKYEKRSQNERPSNHS